MPPLPDIRVIRPGNTSKTNPFTVCVVANPALEAPWRTGQFMVDPIASQQNIFNTSVAYIERALFGMLPNQAEQFLGDASIAPGVRMISVFVQGLSPADANSLVAQDAASNILVARRTAFNPFLAQHGLQAAVIYAISASQTHTRASAWFTSDDDAGPGTPFTLDGITLHHRHNALIPGTIAQLADGAS